MVYHNNSNDNEILHATIQVKEGTLENIIIILASWKLAKFKEATVTTLKKSRNLA